MAVPVLLLSAPVATAGAQDAPQPPAMPTVSVQVDVAVPGVTVDVQAGAVDIAVSTASVNVSVSVSTETASASTVVAGAERQQPTQTDGASDCCHGGAREVAPAAAPPVTSVTAARAPRAHVPKRPRPARVKALPVPVRAIPAARTDPPRRPATATQLPRRTIARRAEVGPTPAPELSAAIRPPPRPTAGARPNIDEGPPVRAADLSAEHMRDNRLLLQLGLLGALLSLGCLASCVSATRLQRRRA